MKATLRIKTYKGKLSKQYYKVAYFKEKYYFVHISKEKLSECKQMTDKKGKKYLEYIGQFFISNEVIII